MFFRDMTQTRKEERPKKDEILLWALRFIFEGANQMRFDEETQETGACPKRGEQKVRHDGSKCGILRL